MHAIFAILLLLAVSCEGPDEAPRAEAIYRLDSQRTLVLGTPKRQPQLTYPWQLKGQNSLFLITKEHFRCKGSSLNPAHGDQTDCRGGGQHSLPLRGSQEYVYPILLQLLNHIQTTTNKQVIITSGHRCPTHNRYIDPSNSASKHQVGAEVALYVRGLEQRPDLVIQIIMDYCSKQPNASPFQRWAKPTDVSTPPWYNQELFLKLYRANEGRNGDNRHSHPYISVQVRFDRERNLRVNYSWEEASRLFSR